MLNTIMHYSGDKNMTIVVNYYLIDNIFFVTIFLIRQFIKQHYNSCC